MFLKLGRLYVVYDVFCMLVCMGAPKYRNRTRWIEPQVGIPNGPHRMCRIKPNP